MHVSGGEYNVAANLADCFGLKTGIATAMVDYGVGEIVQRAVRETGVKPFYKWFQHDGVRGPNIATVYSDRGHGVRAPVVFYNRANEAGAMLKPGDFDWKSIFASGVRWFHSGGIFAALSPTTSQLIVEGMKAAREAGAVTSFDLNYRAKLWKTIGDESKGQEMCREIASHCDVLIGNEEDLQKGLGIEGQDVEAASKLDPQQFFGMIEKVTKKFPNVKLVATTLREVHSTNRHDWAAVVWYDGKQYVSPTLKLDVICRIGGGDGFAAGLIYGMLAGKAPEDAFATRMGPRCVADNFHRRRHDGQVAGSRSSCAWWHGSRSTIVSLVCTDRSNWSNASVAETHVKVKRGAHDCTPRFFIETRVYGLERLGTCEA